MHDNFIDIRKLNKSFYGNQVLKDINLSIAKGSIHGLLGLNGAGKTTLGQYSFRNYQA